MDGSFTSHGIAMVASPTPSENTATASLACSSGSRLRPELGCLLVSGADATAFLNSQFTSDLAAVPDGAWAWAGYCSPKGRLLATVRAGRHGGGWALQAPAAIVTGLRDRLRRFVLRAKVTLDCPPVESAWVEHPRGAWPMGLPTAMPPGGFTTDGGCLFLALADGSLLVHGRAPTGAVPDATAWGADVLAGAPWILPGTEEAFIPQMMDLERIGGVSFTKGCYPGQEVVARAQHLGEVRRRLHRVRVGEGSPPAPGQPVRAADAAAGSILYAAAHPSGGAIALAVLDVSLAAQGTLSLEDDRALTAVERLHPAA
jgi:hypothetical protein